MRDAFGGVANLVIIVVFLTLVSGYLAFNVNYTKAFRVKNKIISLYEQYEGRQCYLNDTSECNNEIRVYMQALGYDAPYLNLTEQGYKCYYGYCAKEYPVEKVDDSVTGDTKEKAYYNIVTQINIDIPIINKILPGLKIFEISGDTKPIVVGIGKKKE